MTSPMRPQNYYFKNKKNKLHSKHKTPRTPKKQCSDRYIPNRALYDIDWSEYMLKDNPILPSKNRTGMANMEYSASLEEYTSTLVDTLFPNQNGKVFNYSSNVRTSNKKTLYPIRELDNNNNHYNRYKKKQRRNIPKVPEKILDAPDFIDDYYLNLLDWGYDNLLAVALGRTVYLWNAETSDITELLTLEEDDYVCSVSWATEGQYLAVGTYKGSVEIYDCFQNKLIRILRGHGNRVSSLSWNGQLISSGSRDSSIINFDVGEHTPVVSVYEGHDQEVCGLKWNPEGTQLASGGNDNLLLVWDKNNSSAPKLRIEDHQAAVKAIEWCPHQSNLLVSGGGTADRHIRFWNTSSGSCLGANDTKSQVCSILWSKTHKNELISSHGFSQNQLTVWEYPHMNKLTELSGHTQRVLQMAMSPDGETIVSVAADETLRFWKVFEKPNITTTPSKNNKTSRLMGHCFIR